MHIRRSLFPRIRPVHFGFSCALFSLLALLFISCSNEPTTSPQQEADPLDGERINSFYTNEEIRYLLETTIGPASDSATLVKWYNDIRIYWEGGPAARDTTAIRDLAATLDRLIAPINITVSSTEPNVIFHFVPRDEYRLVEDGAYSDPYANGWMYYSYLDGISNVSLLVPTDEYPDGMDRQPTMLRSLGFALGFRRLSATYPESMFYIGWNGVVEPALIDKTVIQMLYLPEIESRMTRAQIIEALTDR